MPNALIQRFLGAAPAAALLLFTIITASAALAQNTFAGPPQADGSRPLTRAEVEAALVALDADPSVEDSLKAAERQKFQEALAALATADEYSARAQTYLDAARSGPERVAELRTELELPRTIDNVIAQAEAGRIDELHTDIEARRAQLSLLKQELDQLAKDTARIESRPLELSARLPEVQRELAVLREQLSSSDSTAPSVRADAERIVLRGREAMLAHELEMLQSEQQSQAVRLELLAARQAVLTRRIEASEIVIDRLMELENARLASAAGRFRELAAGLTPELVDEYPAAAQLAEEAEVLADELELAVANTQQATASGDDLRSRLAGLDADYSSIREQLQLRGGGRAMVQVLFSLDRRCSRASEELRGIPTPTLEQTRLAELRTHESLQRHAALDQLLPQPRPEGLDDLVESRRQVLEELDRQYGTLIRALSVLEQTKREYLEQAEEVRGYIGEQLFGFGLKACPPISLVSLSGLPDAARWMFQGRHWLEIVRGTSRVATERPLSTLAVFLAAAVVLIRRRRIIANLEETGARVRRLSTDRYGATGAALLWTLLLAVPGPLLMLYAGWAMSRLPPASDWLWGVAYGLHAGGWVLFPAVFAVSVMRSHGLGDAHFSWKESNLEQLRYSILAATAVYLPAFLLTLSCSYGDASVHFESLGRTSFIVAHLWMAFVLYRLLFAPAGTSFADSDDPSRRFLVRWRRVWSALLLAAPLTLVALAMLGYLISAIMLSLGVVVTLSLVLAGAVLQGLALRWLRMRHRRLAVAEELERRRARQESATAPEGSPSSSELVEVESEEEAAPDLDAVAEQTRDLISALFGLATLMAILVYWSQSFPLPELASAVAIPLTGGTTLLEMALAFVIVVVSVIIIRTLPGLLEITVLRTTSAAPGTRHAIATLCRYAVIAISAALVLDVVEVDWAKFGWIAAALSVGLGFGLQEIVANFVSGLILLFERPLRVGDVVTVEGMTGTVTRIQMRATTITNWDRQEFVVPNKTLITNTLLNWTLSAPLNRLVIPVGVAYGSDTERARQILLEVAADHPRILAEPEPMATFEQFADSSLSLVLRAFLPDMESRLATLTELHAEIQRRFADAGIEIAFPQLDLHVRSGWKSE